MTHVIKFTLKVVCRASWRSGPQEIRIRPHRMENSSGRGAVTGHLLEAERDQAEDGPDKGAPWVSRKSPVSTAELPFALHPWTHWYSLPRTPQTCFQEPDSMSSFLTDSAKQQGTDLLRGLAPGLRLCHGGSAALSALQFPCSPPRHPRGFCGYSLFGHQMGVAFWWMETVSHQMLHLMAVSSRSGSWQPMRKPSPSLKGASLLSEAGSISCQTQIFIKSQREIPLFLQD